MSLTLRVALSALTRPRTMAYGTDPSQRAELHLPGRGQGPWPLAVLLHGGHWQARFGTLVCRPLAADLARRGWAAWNLEYRRLGAGGGWPETFEDVAAGIDSLAGLQDPRLDLGRVVVVGHSAGGQLALWAASRATLPHGAVGAEPRVAVHGVVALAPVTHLERAGVHARALLGGGPDEVPVRWQQADPMRMPPPPVPTLVVHPAADRTVPLQRSRDYVERCRAAGGDVTLVELADETHRDPINPSSGCWRAAAAWLCER